MVTLKVNGQDHAYDGDATVPLLWVIRDELGKTPFARLFALRAHHPVRGEPAIARLAQHLKTLLNNFSTAPTPPVVPVIQPDSRIEDPAHSRHRGASASRSNTCSGVAELVATTR